jgi:hypothetical protein
MTILLLDANENTNLPELEGITRLSKNCNLVNAYQAFYQDFQEFPTHINGSKTIDYLLVSENELQFIARIGYIKFYKCYDLDH